MQLTRKALLRSAGGLAAGGVVAGAGTQLATGGTDVALDRHWVTPFQPALSVSYPSSWHAYSGLMTEILDPHLIVSSRPLLPLSEVDGLPDMREVPSDATLLVVTVQTLEPGADTSTAFPFAATMHFAHLGSGESDDTPGVARRYSTWYVSGSHCFSVYLLVGSDAGPGWQAVEGVVDSIRLA